MKKNITKVIIASTVIATGLLTHSKLSLVMNGKV